MPMAEYHSASSVKTYASCFRQVTSYTPGTFFPHPPSSGSHIFTSRLGFTCHPPCISSLFFREESMAPFWRSTKRDKMIHFLPPWRVVYSLGRAMELWRRLMAGWGTAPALVPFRDWLVCSSFTMGQLWQSWLYLWTGAHHSRGF